VNILRGPGIDAKQEEFALLLDEPRLALNVNTREDIARTEAFLTAGRAR
jgi:GTP:adenosylcobinamide-phosphate guanylyltransferase